MKIGREIFYTVLWISLAVLVINAGAALIQLSRIRSSALHVHNTQSELLVDTNLEVLTSFNQDVVIALAQVYSESLESAFMPITNRLMVVRNYLENAYNRGEGTGFSFDLHDMALRADVSFEDVEEEFRIIQSVRDLMRFMPDPAVMIYYASASGMMISSKAEEYDGVDFTERYWFIGAAEQGGLYWSYVYADIATGELMITAAVPVHDAQGRLMGVVGYDILLEHLVDDILRTPADIIEFTFLLDCDGGFIIGSEPSRGLDYIVPEAARNALTAAMLEHDDGAGLFIQEEVIAGFAFIPTVGWHVGVLVDYQRISEPIMQIDEAVGVFGEQFTEYLGRAMRIASVISSIIAVAAILMSVFISRAVTRSITKPIEILTVGVGKVSGGDLDYKIDVKSGNEFEILADSFNAMTASLREHVENMLALSTESERLATELNIATQIQADMLPSIFPPFPERDEFDVYAYMMPAKEVGGDFYDFFLVDERTLAVVIADVSGKGVPAALFMVITKTLIKNSAQSGKSPKEVFETVNHLLCENNDSFMFVTAFLGYLDIPTGRFTYVNAGHNPPLFKTDGTYEWLRGNPDFVLAMFEDTPYTQHELLLPPGGELFLYTDGVTEAMNNKHELFGSEPMREVLNRCGGIALRELTLSIKNELDKFAEDAEQADDITMLVLRLA